MNSNIILSKELGLLLQGGLHALTSLMTSLVKFTKSSISQKIWEILGNILKAMYLILHGEQLPSQVLWVERMLSQEYSSLMIQILRDTKKQEKDGSRVFISTTLTISSKPRTMLLMLVTVLL